MHEKKDLIESFKNYHSIRPELTRRQKKLATSHTMTPKKSCRPPTKNRMT